MSEKILLRFGDCCGGAAAIIVSAFTELPRTGFNLSMKPCLTKSDKYACLHMVANRQNMWFLQEQLSVVPSNVKIK